MSPSTPAARTVALFGASGSIGQAICQRFLARGDRVLAFSRRGAAPEGHRSAATWLAWDQHPAPATLAALQGERLGAVVWAQGQNCTDSIRDFDEQVHRDLYEANVLFVLRSLHELLQRDLLARPARLCIISSVWQDIVRPNKLSYCVSKAALRGLVQSVAMDLGPEGHLVNAVLPGALDTPMTRANLKPEQIARLAGMTPLARLPALDDVCATVDYLCAPSNTSVTGQFVAVDGGFSHAKFL
ncbi:MAG: putative oxo-acyl acyl carrier protein dehydrogenase [Ramlibacter sp.]|nr:putative oxo-acyl acyl carrier protein dehydrogenase [Ramlibacter sp.]